MPQKNNAPRQPLMTRSPSGADVPKPGKTTGSRQRRRAYLGVYGENSLVNDEHLVCVKTVRQQFRACLRHQNHVLNMPVAHMRFEGEDHALL